MTKGHGFPGLSYLNSLADWRGSKDFSLSNIRAVMSYLGDPQDKVANVHVAGTNGKGSVSASVASILGQTGAKVGLTTSPHLSTINERVVVDGFPVGDYELNSGALAVMQAAKSTKNELSFFEGITAVAFHLFSELSVEYSVLEVGLGGRLDATNIIKTPEVAIIVSIDFDHEHILGDTLALIAEEKAGIIKPTGKVVSGMMQAEALKILEFVSRKQHARHVKYGSEYTTSKLDTDDCLFQWGNEQPFSYKSALPGEHQARNAAVAIASGKLLGIENLQCAKGVAEVFWPGRLEVSYVNSREIILDCAHNPAGVETLVSHLSASGRKDLVICFGVLETKNWREMVKNLLPFSSEWCLLRPNSPRAVPPETIAEFLAENNVNARVYDTNYEQFLSDTALVGDERGLLITGSIYMIGELRPHLIAESKPIWRKVS